MSEIILFEHNEIGYNKLVDTLKDNACATVNHATGTGKSFIALKYLYKNRDKKYLYLAPTYHILNQLIERDAKTLGIDKEELNVDTAIYGTLLKMDMRELYEKYDGFILDEYHRGGSMEVYKKLSELKSYISQGKSKKFIGLTATPIRYLDNERNMTEELFDGVVASEIQLADAIIDGLLPTPKCICSLISCSDKYGKVASKVKKMGKSDEKAEYLKVLGKIGQKITSKEAFYNLFREHIKEKDGKYIVFCNSIEELNNYRIMADTWFPGEVKLKKYSVHSARKVEDNQKTLNEFNNVNSGMNLLFCVDVLNEGVHVSGVDGVVMLRRTMSPRIYFQQMGRALSYSNRKKDIKIFDLVNNFSNHNAIYSVYLEVVQRLNERYSDNPEKRKEVLEKFEIFDSTTEAISKLDEINKEIEEKDLIRQTRIREALEKLEAYFAKSKDQGFMLSNKLADPALRKAYFTLCKYEKYMKESEFIRLSDIPILFPRTLGLTLEDRKKELGDFETFEEKEKEAVKSRYNKLVEYIASKKELPDLEVEKELYECFSSIFINGSIIEQKKLKEVLNKAGVKLNYVEKVLVGERITVEDFKELKNLAENTVESGKPLPNNLYVALDRLINLLKDKKAIELIFNIILKSEVIQGEIEDKEYEKKVESLESLAQMYEESLVTEGESSDKILNEIRKLSTKERKMFITRVNNKRKKKMSDFLVGVEKQVDISKAISEFHALNLQELGGLFSMAESNSKMYLKVEQVLEFIINNEGRLPNKNSENATEKLLAEYLDEFYSDERIREEIKTLKLNNRESLELFKEVLDKKTKEAMAISTMVEVLIFVKDKDRKPLPNSHDEAEVELAKKFTMVSGRMINDPVFIRLFKLINADRYLLPTIRAYNFNIGNLDNGR